MALLTLHPCRPRISVSEAGPLPSLLSAKRFLPVTLRAQGGRVEGKKTVAPKGVRCEASRRPSEESGGGVVAVKDKSVSVILLAGGKGKRMGASMPKQYLPLLGQPIALYSFYTFSRMNEVNEVIVVCDPSYMDVFQDSLESHVNLKFAIPLKERQDSVFSGFQEIDRSSELVCIHDSARPLVLNEDIRKVLWVPGCFEIPVVAQQLGKSGKYDAILCIGAVVRGDTTHYDAVANSAASGVLSAGIQSGVPCIFGVLTCDDMDQALNRAGGKAGNKGAEAALTAIEMASLFVHHLKG